MESEEYRMALERALRPIRGGSRRERQQAEIVGLVMNGRMDRARALGAAHLAEFPDDPLVGHLLGTPPLDVARRAHDEESDR